MPKILITGNGFDLNFGLPTLYSDFINILSSLDEGEVTFQSVYSKTSNFEKISKNFKIFIFEQQNLKNLKDEIDRNQWFAFFKKELNIETWIDFEKTIEYVLKIILSSFKMLEENVFSKGSLSVGDMRQSRSTLNKNSEIIGILQFFNIISNQDNNFYYLNKDYLIKRYSKFVNIDKEKISKLLHFELIKFIKIFNHYIEIFIYPLYANVNINIDKTLFNPIDKHYTFNYTPTFEKIYGNNITKFLHGKVDLELSNIVLGINEIPDEDNIDKHFISFTKYFQKLRNNTDYTFIDEYKRTQSQNYIFFLFGHSLDNSDEDYINEVFDFIDNVRSSIRKIIIIYHNENSKSNLLINLLRIRGKENVVELMKNKNLLLLSIESSELKEELRSNIASSSNVYPI